MKFEDTIIAPATVPGTGALSVIRISGPLSFHAGDRLVSLKHGRIAETPGGRVRFGEIALPDGEPLDEVLVSVFKAPLSYTGEDMLEISCHASSYIVGKIIELFINEGLRLAGHGEFTKRAFINGKMDLAQAESVADLIAAEGAASHRAAMNQLRGGFSAELKELRRKLLEMTALMELELDFSEEDVEFADRKQLTALLEEALSRIGRLVRSFRLGNAVRNGVPAAIVGPTNAGKSTLLNNLLHEDRAIVSEIAGTTRDTIEETVNIDGILFRFIDTAGLRETEDAIEKIGIDRTFRKISEADIILGVLDCGMDDLAGAAAQMISKTDSSCQRLILLLNKIDFYAPEVTAAAERTVYGVLAAAGFGSGTEREGPSGNAKTGGRPDQGAGNRDSAPMVLKISARDEKDGEKVAGLLSGLMKDRISGSKGTLVTNYRHYQALVQASAFLQRVKEGLLRGVPTDLAAQDLREGLARLGEILGEITTDEVLGTVFEKFCIGK